MSRRAASTVGSLLLLALALTACATPAGSGGTPAPRGETSTAPTEDADIDAAWLDDGRTIGLVTSGSSTYIPFATDVSLDAGVLNVTLEDPDGQCTRDLVPRVTLVQVPEGVDPAQELEIRVTGSVTGDTDLDGVDGLAGPGSMSEYLPSAAWTDTDGLFILATGGSSTCLPEVQDVAATGPAEVTVTFAEPPADQVCTMDMVLRGTLVEVTGLQSDDDVVAVLTGAEFDNVRVPILGSD